MKSISKLFLMVVLLCWRILPMFGLDSSKHFYGKGANSIPTGAGEIYVQRGRVTETENNDIFNPPASGWKSSDETFDAGKITVNKDNLPDGFKIYNGDEDDKTTGVLYIYFYAKPNAGFQFDGWYEDAAATKKLKGSTEVYSLSKQSKSPDPRTPTRWDNGTPGSEPPEVGEWDGVYYVRHVEEVKNGQKDDIYRYAKFSIIPRHFMFVGTGFADLTYKAAGTYDVSAETVESGDITANISLSVTFDETKYNFTKWQWSEGEKGKRNDITTTVSGGTATATYEFVAKYGYSGEMVYIWPVLKEKVDYVAEVTLTTGAKTSYASWAEAFDAAKAEGVSGAVITLKKNVDGLDAVQTVDRDMTLNLNGCTITGSVNNMFTVSAGNFTLCDNTPSSAGRIVQNVADATGTTYALTVAYGATLTLTSGGVTAIGVNNVANSAGTSRGVLIQSGGTLVMSGGEIRSQSTNNAYALWNSGIATISGGVCSAHAVGASAKSTGNTAVAFRNEGTSTTVNGGTFIAAADTTTAYGIHHNKSSVTPLTISDATVQSTTGRSGAYALFHSSGKILVEGGKYKATTPINRSSTSQIELRGGLYDNFDNLRACASDGYDCYELEPGNDYNAGYRFVIKGLDASPNVCKVITLNGTTYYDNLADAFAYVAAYPNDQQSIVMTAFEYNFTTPGDYVIPQQTAFVIPYGEGQTGAQTTPTDIRTWASLSQYHLLSLGAGVNITVNGSFTVGGQQFGTSSSNPGPGSVTGQYAVLDMSAGGTLTIANGANLYAYGFIKGSGDQSTAGTITIQNGGTVYENLVVNDMHGGGGTAACVNGTKGSNNYGLFPFNQYFIQNIEPRMTIEYGGIEKASYNIQSSQGGQMGMINAIGNASDYLFQMASGSAITKWYDASRDYQCYEVRGGITMNGLTLDAGMAIMASSNFILPITNNMDIRAVSGAVLDMPYSLKFLPGSKLTIDEGAIVDIHKEMYVYDYQDWDKYAISYAQTYNIPWHTLRNVSSAAALGNANIVINGQLRIKDSGALYTTSHGGNITSTGAGKIIFNVAGKSANENLYECWSVYGKKSNGAPLAQGETNIAAGQVRVGSFNMIKTWYIYGTPVECNPAMLRNSNDTYLPTSGAVAGDIYQYCDGTWTKGGCVTYHTIVWKNADGSVLETDENVPYGATPEYNGTTPVKTGEEQAYSFAGWTPEVTTVNGDAEYTATYTRREYTITWKNADNALLATTKSYWGDMPEYPNPTPTYTDNEHHVYRFVGWTPEVHAVNSDVNVYKATYERVDNLDVPGEQTINVETTVTTTKVHVTGHLVVTSNLKTTDLILEGTLNTSGEIENNGTVTATNVYYDLSNGAEGFKARTWYAIAVPWQVDVPAYNQAGCGVYLTNDGVNYSQQNLGASFDLLYYDGAYRAQNGPSSKCWKLVEKDAAANHIIFPGRAYMIYLTSNAKTIRFKKKATADLFTNQTQVQLYVQQTGNDKDANWNGIANPATFHAYLNTASGNQGQIYIAGADRYEPIADMSAHPLVVGQPVFVQATNNKTVVAYATNDDNVSHAPRRMSSSNEEKIMAEVRIAPLDKAYTDRLYVGAEEFKTDEYEIGKDLAKAGVSTKVAQMWVNRYNAQLCINSMELVNNRAEYPLTISAPAAGEYTIGMEPSAMAENQTYVLYLTLNGQPIWNLNYNAYTATLEKGTTEGYGLRLVYNAPEITTGIEETTILNGEQVRKVMIDEKVYIIRGGQVYSIDGQLVKY